MNKRSLIIERGRWLWTKCRQPFLLVLPFLCLDIWMRVVCGSVNYFRWPMVLPNVVFTVSWITLLVGVSRCIRGIGGKLFYGVTFAVFWVMALANAIYFSLTGYFISFRLLEMADEGSAYILEVMKGASPLIYLVALLSLAVGILVLWKVPGAKKHRPKHLAVLVIGFVVLHMLTPLMLGKANSSLEWDTWRNPRNVYEDFNDSNKNMKICGLYEYTVRDFCVSFFRSETEEDPEELAYLEEAYGNLTQAQSNEYTGIYEGKNVIFLQLEGLDNWLLNAEDTPTLYGMLSESLVFENHYSYYNGGGSTFNSEFAVNTGFITPISYMRNAYTFSGNCYDYSLPNLFKAEGYRANAFHMNTREYYSRGLNYDSWGYDNYFSLLDSTTYADVTYELDRELIENELFYKELFRQEGPFLHYVITYTPHTPFTTDSELGELLAKIHYPDGKVPEMDEEECARFFAAETDYAVELLLQALKDNGLYENTVIVAFADHYLYTLNDKTALETYKITEDNRINHTPFFIWSAGQEREVVEKVNSQLDIMPTVLNLFGIEYVPEYYIGTDIFREDYEGYVFFSDYSWYDGEHYVQDGAVVVGEPMDEAELSEKNARIHQLIRKNDLTLKYDYLNRMGRN